MAGIEKYRGKRKLSYRISVRRNGVTEKMTFVPESSLTEEQADKAAEKAAQDFEKSLREGYNLHKRYTVDAWIDYVLQNKKNAGRKNKTISSYEYAREKLGSRFLKMQIADVTPQDIANLLHKLQTQNKETESRTVIKPGINLLSVINAHGYSKQRLAREAGIASSTLDNLCNGKNVLYAKAAAIASVLNEDPSHLFDIIESTEKLSGSTVHICRRFLTMLFGVAVRERVILYNPATSIEPISNKRKKKVDTLQIDEVQEILRYAENEPIHKRLVIHLLLITGCRRSEIAGLRWSNLDWANGTLLVDGQIQYTKEHGLYEDTTKTENEKLLKLPIETMELLRTYKTWQDDKKQQSGYTWAQPDRIFTNQKGGLLNPDTINGYVQRFRAKYDLPPMSPHKFRHTMASMLLYAGSDIVAVSKRLGHANVSTTQNIYSHLIRKADVENAEHIADIMLRGKKG